MVQRPSCSTARGGLPGSRIKPVSPLLADEFFTSEPPRKPCKAVFQAAAWLYLENKDQ